MINGSLCFLQTSYETAFIPCSKAILAIIYCACTKAVHPLIGKFLLCVPEVLQKQIDEGGGETLSPSDKLYVVHVKQGKDNKEKAWSAGGPLLPSLQMALARYPHTIIELEVLSFVLLPVHTSMTDVCCTRSTAEFCVTAPLAVLACTSALSQQVKSRIKPRRSVQHEISNTAAWGLL